LKVYQKVALPPSSGSATLPLSSAARGEEEFRANATDVAGRRGTGAQSLLAGVPSRQLVVGNLSFRVATY